MLIIVAFKLKRCLSFITRFCCVETNAKTNAKINEFVCEIVTKTNNAKSTNETNAIESIMTKIKKIKLNESKSKNETKKNSNFFANQRENERKNKNN